MSFDLSLVHFQDGDSAPISAEGRAAMIALIDTTSHDGQDDFGYYVPFLPDGSSFEMNAKGIHDSQDFSGVNFHLRGFGASTIRFIYELAMAGDLTVINAQSSGEADDPMFITTAAAQSSHLPEGMEMAQAFCPSAEVLAQILSGDYEAWSDFREQVLGQKE